jgi:hypothetical protein
MLCKVINVKTIVEDILKENKDARSNDRLLVGLVWERQSNSLELSFKEQFLGGRLSCPESIRRARQLAQQRDESLKGNKEVRKALSKEFRDNVRFI